MVGSDSLRKHQALVSPSEHKLIRQTSPDEQLNTEPLSLAWEGSRKRAPLSNEGGRLILE